jgi:PAS domain S-box-containing protein
MAQLSLLEMVLDQLTNGVLVCDTQGKILFLNNAARHLIGPQLNAIGLETVASAMGRVCYPSGDVMPLEEWTLSQALHGETVVNQEERLIRLDGSYSDILVSGTPLRNNQGTVMAAILTCVDITAQAVEKNQSIAFPPSFNPIRFRTQGHLCE